MTEPRIDKLFRVHDEAEVTVRGRVLKVFLRTLTGVDEQLRHDYAVAQARGMLRALKRKSSSQYAIYMREFDEAVEEDRPGLIELAVSLKTQRFATEAERAVVPEEQAETPDEPTLTDILEAKEKQEELDQKLAEKRLEFIQQAQKTYEEELGKMDLIDLCNQARELLADSVHNAEFSRAYNDATLYYGVFEDEKCTVRLFASPKEAGEADPALYGRLLMAYTRLDGYAQQPEELKN